MRDVRYCSDRLSSKCWRFECNNCCQPLSGSDRGRGGACKSFLEFLGVFGGLRL